MKNLALFHEIAENPYDYAKKVKKESGKKIVGYFCSYTPEEIWDNLPIWYRTKWLSEKFAAHDACLVADTYTSAW